MKTTILFLFFLPLNLIAQHTDFDYTPFLSGLNNYRSYLIRNDTSNTMQLKRLLNKWNAVGMDEKTKGELCLNYATGSMIYGMSLKSLKRKTKAHLKLPASFIDSITKEDLTTITQNIDLIELINESILQHDFPYKLNPTSSFLWEMAFYKIKKGMRVGEIGSGNGTFSMALALCIPNLTLYINELSNAAIDRINYKFNHCPLITKDSIFVVKGKKSTTRLEGKALDMVIIRQSFHHFSNKTNMLNSIAAGLKVDGILFISDPVIELDPTKTSCPDILSKAEIISLLEENDFKFIEARERNRSVVLKFVKK